MPSAKNKAKKLINSFGLYLNLFSQLFWHEIEKKEISFAKINNGGPLVNEEL